MRRKQDELFHGPSIEDSFSNCSQNPDIIKENDDIFKKKKTHSRGVRGLITRDGTCQRSRGRSCGAQDGEAWPPVWTRDGSLWR